MLRTPPVTQAMSKCGSRRSICRSSIILQTRFIVERALRIGALAPILEYYHMLDLDLHAGYLSRRFPPSKVRACSSTFGLRHCERRRLHGQQQSKPGASHMGAGTP